jgi:hypothetical protein
MVCFRVKRDVILKSNHEQVKKKICRIKIKFAAKWERILFHFLLRFFIWHVKDLNLVVLGTSKSKIVLFKNCYGLIIFYEIVVSAEQIMDFSKSF